MTRVVKVRSEVADAAEIKGDVLIRLVQLALRWIFSDQPLEHLERLIALIDQIADCDTALQSPESLLRYDVHVMFEWWS
ncbi:hypothetical protein [Halochromatium roseum]|uniref:hypothetical protein n=1 Tax=Halochromatium roseum TaxID=391920 RepID=UPI001913A72A|nr:hypothetical protein [Halochromatium roseum]MBK5942109.1 hypothetical protein [Halochromatium roseum]